MTLFRRKTWRSTFYLATGLSTICLILGMLSIDADLPSTETDRRIDWLGSLIVTTGLVLVVFVLSDGEIVGWSTSCNSLDTLVSESLTKR
jgi:predicted MFS family arabinose efflux permease